MIDRFPSAEGSRGARSCRSEDSQEDGSAGKGARPFDPRDCSRLERRPSVENAALACATGNQRPAPVRQAPAVTGSKGPWPFAVSSDAPLARRRQRLPLMPRYLQVLTCAVLLAAPLLLVDVPPLLDYPNHLARLTLLATDDPVLTAMFTTQWAIIPNLAVDLIGPPLIRLFPVHTAGRIVLALCLLLPFAGVLAYSRALFGRLHPWPLASALIAINAPFLLGFMNFQIGVGAALLLAAFWITWRDRYPGAIIALATLGMIALFFCHLMGVLFALVLITARELERPSLSRALAILPLIAAPAVLYRYSPLGDQPAGIDYLPIAGKITQLLWPFTTYNLPLDLLTAVAVVAFLLICTATNRLTAPRSTRIALATFAALYAVSPYAFKATQSLDTRFTLMFALTLFAGVRPTSLPPRFTHLAIAAAALLFTGRTALTATAWHAHNTDLADLRQIIAEIPPGARVLTASVSPGEAPDYWSHTPAARRLSNTIRTDTHLPALALIERHAFWPLLFNDPSQQPIAWTAPLQSLADQAGGLIDHLSLKPTQLCHYDFLLLLSPQADPTWLVTNLTLHTTTRTAALFTIAQAGRDCP